MQCLIYCIREEVITIDVFCQGMAHQKIRMENKQVTRSAFYGIQIQVWNLIRRSKAAHTLIVIIMLLTISDFAFRFPFQCNTIKPVHKTFPYIVLQENAFREVNYTHQRMTWLRQRE